MRRALAVLLVALLWWAAGPWALVAALGLLLVPRIRRAFWNATPLTSWSRRRWLATTLGVVALLAGAVIVIPDGVLPIPPGPGRLVAPGYLGRPATAQPVRGYDIPTHPHLAPNGTNSIHNDAWASDAYHWAGPMGIEPRVDTAWYGVEECATLTFDSRGRLVGLCGSLAGPSLRVIDPESMRPLASLELPRHEDSDVGPWEDLCGGAYSYLDERDRAVLPTTDGRILAVSTADGDGDPDLTVDQSWDLSARLGGDCLIALLPDHDGRIWFLTQQGLVGTVAPGSGAVRVLDLGEEIANSFAVDQDAAYVVSDTALYRLEADGNGRPMVGWRYVYDRGLDRKPGQFTRGSGTTPTILNGGLVAITDNADPRMHVVMVDAASGRERCRAPVFDDGASATENSLVGLGDAVIVENNYGYSSPLATLFGRSTSAGLARVSTDCHVDWTNEEIAAPTSVPKASLATGIVYVYEKRSSWWGVAAWYLTAVDVHTGRRLFSVRTGTGSLMNNNYAAIYLAPDTGAAYVATLGGLVRVADRS